MNYGDECYIMYDKYTVGNHSFNNAITSKYKIKDLFETKIDNPQVKYYTDADAVVCYNQTFGDKNFVLPNDINHDIIKLHLFMFNDEEHNCNVIITVIGIIIDKFTAYFNRTNTIPSKEFIITACRYHIQYEKMIELSEDDQHAQIVKDIADKVLVPNGDVTDAAIDNPDFIAKSMKLYDYQRRTVKWMLDTEINKKKVYYGMNYRFAIEIGPIVFDIIKKAFTLKEKQNYLQFNGGALIDEVGRGKTIQTLSLCMLNPLPVNQMEYIDKTHKMFKSRATLVMCPNQLCNQWIREIKSKISRTDLKVVQMMTKPHFDKTTYQELLDADFVIVSYTLLEKSWFATKYTKTLSTSKSYHKTNWNEASVKNVFKTMNEELLKNPLKTLFSKEPLFPLIFWHRIVIDEFHEPYTLKDYIYIKNIIPLMKGTYKWVVTGTPFNAGTGCFYNMLNFVVDYSNSLNENIVQIPEIKQHMLNTFFKRNTEESTKAEAELPGLKEKIVWLRFTHTERMMYNAYLTDPNMSKFSVILRQICCHPKIADEIKGILSNCKTLSDIETSMVVHYKRQCDFTLRRVKKCEQYIAKTKRRMLVAEFKRQRKYLKKIGYRVTFDLPPFVLEKIEDLADDEQALAQAQAQDQAQAQAHDDEDDDYDQPKKAKKINNIVNNNVDEDEDDNNDGLDIDDDSDDDDDNNTNKPLMIISLENQTKIMSLIKKQLDENPSLTIRNYVENLEKQTERLAQATKIYEGKRATFNFFNNMLERIKKFTEKSKAKYEKIIAKNRRRDEGQEEDSSSDESDDEADEDNCGICLCEISGEDVGVTKCGHLFCFDCLKAFINSSGRCPLCQTPQTNKDISMISFEKPVFTAENSSILKNKLELIDKLGTKLTNLIYYLSSIPDKVIIFSQWDTLLKKVGDVLSEHGIRTVYCKGNIWSRDKAIRDFTDDENIKVIMLSSESAASGTNLTAASKVILLDPVSGTYEHRRNTEWQAIGRAYRLGQRKQVEIIRFIIKDTVEEDIYRENKVEDNKQTSQLHISEISDETINLSDDKLHSLAEAVQRAKERKEQREKEKKERKEKLANKVVKVVKKTKNNNVKVVAKK
jgi:SNF2 family DNA or RNA helicase